jgi:hypothetical protein
MANPPSRDRPKFPPPLANANIIIADTGMAHFGLLLLWLLSSPQWPSRRASSRSRWSFIMCKHCKQLSKAKWIIANRAAGICGEKWFDSERASIHGFIYIFGNANI